jgi:aflatoxin B1 aldehyde reductase
MHASQPQQMVIRIHQEPPHDSFRTHIQVETYFLHSPDADTPLEETLSAINELHTRNTFRAFGISNFTPSDVEKIHSICTSNSYVLPTVYQGNYNPVSRAYETTLFPLLRKLNISFYAYSPIAGGFLVKTAEAIQGGTAGRRWDTSNPAGSLYPGLYKKPALLKALADWNDIASDAGVGRAELAYRWVAYHSNIDKSKGDAVIIGASKPEQLEETLGALNAGPLDEGIAERVRGIYESVKHEAPVDNFHG